MSTKFIELKNISKFYANNKALENINLYLNKNEVVGILGLNGAGKSTTLKILAGILPPSEGEIYLENECIFSDNKKMSEKKISLGYLPEFVTFYPELTVKNFLYFMLTIKNVPKEEQSKQYEEIIRKTNLEDHQDTIIKYLSLGYQKRVGIAQAISGNSQLIILDEAISGLDPRQIIEIRNLIRNLSKDHTIIISSHILSEISQTCDRVYILHKGKMVAEIQKENLNNLEKIFMEVTQ
ncbi:MAG: ABC transporter ATP-binding protein [Leptonema sp. (in: bacteria)]